MKTLLAITGTIFSHTFKVSKSSGPIYIFIRTEIYYGKNLLAKNKVNF